MAFLRPTGQYGIGSVELELVDENRPRFINCDDSGRKILVKLWYPSMRDFVNDAELLWSDARTNHQTPVPMRLFLACLRHRTSTSRAAPLHVRSTSWPVVVYNHGLISFPSENTSLVEDLASHGCVVVSVSHAAQYCELQHLNASQSPEKKKKDNDLMQQLNYASREEKQRLATEYYRESSNTNLIVMERATDTCYVMDHLAEVFSKTPGYVRGAIDESGASQIGFSVGGAVASEVATKRATTLAVVNLDGGMYGSLNTTNLFQPYLMLYSSSNEDINASLLPSHAKSIAPPLSKHLNYHDVSMVLPLLRFTGATGKTEPKEFIQQRNSAVRTFLLTADTTEAAIPALRCQISSNRWLDYP